jgi:hypothetical protein
VTRSTIPSFDCPVVAVMPSSLCRYDFCLVHPSGRCFKLIAAELTGTRGAIVQGMITASPYIN